MREQGYYYLYCGNHVAMKRMICQMRRDRFRTLVHKNTFDEVQVLIILFICLQ